MAPAAILRVIINPGHGLNNAHVGSYDQGALSCIGGASEHALVQAVADDVVDGPGLPVAVTETPECSPLCARHHEMVFHKEAGRKEPVSHLSYLIDWCNEQFKQGDYLLSLHMDAPDEDSPDPTAPSGVSVYFSAGAVSGRKTEALAVGAAVAQRLGIPFRGAFPDTSAKRQHLGILDDTIAPAVLIEMGFVTNPGDVDAVKACGGEAVADGIRALYALRSQK